MDKLNNVRLKSDLQVFFVKTLQRHVGHCKTFDSERCSIESRGKHEDLLETGN